MAWHGYTGGTRRTMTCMCWSIKRRRASAVYGLILLLLHPGNGGKIAMCGRFEQSETPRYYANALSAHISERLKTLSDNTTVFALPGPAATRLA